MGGGLSKDVLETKHVVIVGGGYGGMELASNLKKYGIPFTLIDPKEYFHHCVGALRGVIEPDFLPKTAIDFKTSFGDSFVQGSVASVDFVNKKVVLESGDSLQYTDLVFAVGSKGPYPGTPNHTNIKDHFDESKQIGSEIYKSSKVVIVGGGAVGVEMAGEIKDRYPDKEVTIIHSRDHLVTMSFGSKFQSNVQDILTDKCVSVILEDRVSNLSTLVGNKCMKQTVSTDKGKEIECDIVIKTTGLGPNTSLTKKIFNQDAFEDGRLKVDEVLRVAGESNVYAIGDCNNTKEEKMAAHAGTQGSTVASNLLLELQGKDKAPYKSAFTGMLLTVGKKYGAGFVMNLNLPWTVVGLVKGGSMFSEKYWSLMGQKIPSQNSCHA